MATVNATGGELNIIGKADDDLVVTLTFIDDDTEAAENMSGGTWEAKARVNVTDVAAAATATVDVTSAASGIIVVSFSDTDTAALCTGKVWRGYWDLQWTNGSGTKRTYVEGTMTLLKDVTR